MAQTPESVGKLTKAGFNVVVEKGAGLQASFSDAAYAAAGAKLVEREEAYKANLVTKVTVPTSEEAALVGERPLPSQTPSVERDEPLRATWRHDSSESERDGSATASRGLGPR